MFQDSHGPCPFTAVHSWSPRDIRRHVITQVLSRREVKHGILLPSLSAYERGRPKAGHSRLDERVSEVVQVVFHLGRKSVPQPAGLLTSYPAES